MRQKFEALSLSIALFLRDMVEGLSDFVVDLPCVQQPQGNSCGMATIVNASTAFITQSHNDLMHGGINEALSRFQLPYCSAWTNSDFVVAIRIIVKFYASGKNSVPKLSVLLPRMSLAVAESRSQLKKKKEASQEVEEHICSRLDSLAEQNQHVLQEEKMRNYFG